MTRPGVVMLLALGGLASGLSTQVEAACKMKQYAVVHVDIREDGAVMVPVQVDGKPVWMMLDMAGGVPMAFQSTVEYLGLKMVAAPEIDAIVEGRIVEHKTVIGSLVLGGANFAKWDMYIMPSLSADVPRHRDAPILGALTSRFMTAVDLELNLAQSEIRLFSHTRCGKQVVYWGGEVTATSIYHDGTGLMMFPMEVDGKSVEAAFDTQRRLSRISEAVTSKFFGFDRDSDGIARETREDGSEIASYRAMGLTARGLRVSNVRVRLRDDRNSPCKPTDWGRPSRAIGFTGCFSTAPLSLGTDLLQKLRIYIASKERKIYFTRVEAPAPEPALAAP